MPADKGSYGNFEALGQQNKQVIQKILESHSQPPSVAPSHDEEILRKLRDFYSSCLNEDRLDDIGTIPLLRFVHTVRRLYRGENRVSGDEGDSGGLTAAIAFLHSRGMYDHSHCPRGLLISSHQGVDALFDFNIEGDVGTDPNHMVLWFSQPSLGLPSKVIQTR